MTTGATELGAVSTVFAGADTAAAILQTGSALGALYLWGGNRWGQLGVGTLATIVSTPTQVAAPATWKSVAAGGDHTLAIKSDGTLWAWGLNLNGQLGESGGGYRVSPKQVGTAKDWLAVAAGESHSLAISGSATATKLWAWGRNTEGQLGLATTVATPNLNDVTVPTLITKGYEGTTLTTLPYTGKTWTQIVAGDRHSMVRRSDGQVFSWGDNSYSQLGQATVVNVSLPTAISTLGSLTAALAIAAGGNASVVLQSNQSLYAWGQNNYGQLGFGTAGASVATPTQVGSDVDWFAVSSGATHTLAIKTDQTLWSWGRNQCGQLGLGDTTDYDAPQKVNTSTKWTAVAAGRNHSMALDTDGKLWVWGCNDLGQLGGVTTQPMLDVPTKLP